MIAIYKQHKKIVLVFFVLAFLLYGNALRNKYALDDEYITVTNFPVKGQNYVPNNELVSKGFAGIGKIWKSRYAHDNESSFDYRPITSTSFAIEYGIFGQNPFVSHLINILLYGLTIFVLFCVLLLLFESYENKLVIATLTAFIFLILPSHTEVVNNIKCRDEIFSFLFPLIAFWHCLKAYEKPSAKHLILIVVFLILGYYSKRTAIIFLGVISLSFIFFRKVNLKRVLVAFGLFAIIFIIAFIIKKQVISETSIRKFYHFENPMFTEHFSFMDKIMAAIKTIGYYIKFSIIPYPFRNYYGTNVVDLSSKPDIYLFSAILFLTGSAWYYYKTKNKLFLFGALLFLGGIFPFSNLMTPVAGVVGERLGYNASLGVAVMLSALMAPLFNSSTSFTLNGLIKKPGVYFSPVVLLCVILIWTRNTNWKDKLTLFEHDITHLEVSAKANSLMANEYLEMLKNQNFKYPPETLIQKGIKYYTTAIKNDSSFYSAYNNAGVIYYSYIRDLTNAKLYFKLALKARPVYPQAYENLGNCYKQENKIDSAFQCYIHALKQDPKQYTAYIACVKLFYEAKQYKRAIAINKVAQKYYPADYTLVGQEADAYFMLGNIKPALEKYEEAYNISPSPQLANYLAIKYLELGDTSNYNLYKNK